MSTRTKVIWRAGAGCTAIVLGVGLLLRLVPVRPGPAIRHAQDFADCLRAHELARAYQRTTQRGEVGRSLAEFRETVRRQWPGAGAAPVRFLGARPRQSYGNRLRRWLRGRETDPSELWLEFSVGGVPFEVREARAGGGEWKVDFFQAHAG